jgi:putative peptidoglycan lipid II flippase
MILRRIIDRFLNKRAFFMGSAVLALTTILSYALGLLRDRLFAITFGASRVLDAYNAAFTLPDLILNIFVAGALTAAFVPIFSDLKNSQRHDDTRDFINSVINGSLFVVILSGILVFILVPYLSKFIVPGFDVAARHTFENLVRLLLLSPIIFSISNTLGNIILTHDRFFWYGISAALYNVGIIAGTIFLVPYFGIYGVAIGTIAGALLHLGSRIFGLKYSHKYHFKINFNADYRKFIRLMLPKVIGQPLEQITFLGYTIIASTIGAGSIAILNFARNFQSMPVNTIGITIALASFPILARMSSSDQQIEFRREIKFSLKTILIISIPAAIAVYCFRNILISIFLGGGAFSSEAVRLTGATLGIFAISVPTESMAHLISRGFYALKDSLTPVVVGLGGLVIAIVFGYLFSRSMGIEGLALGFVMGSMLKTGTLFVLLQSKSRHLQ